MHRIGHDQLTRMATQVFIAAGSQAPEADLIARHLVDANLVGHDSHGVVRIRRYIDWLKADQVVPNRHMQILIDRGASVLIDGGFGYGQVVGAEAMDLLATRALDHGFAVTALRNAGHLGRIGAWAERLANAGLVSLHFVNSSGLGILVAPHGGSDRRLSANPIAAGAPVEGAAPLVLDMSTSVVAEGKIALARNKREQLPPGCILDGAGRPTTDPEAFYADPRGAILTVGGHKGSGLSIFCEVFAGALTGGFSSHPDNPTARRFVNNMLSIAFDPAAFGGADFFRDDIARLGAWVRASPPRESGGSVLLPGEVEARVRRERTANGIPVDPETWAQIRTSAASVGATIPENPGDLP